MRYYKAKQSSLIFPISEEDFESSFELVYIPNESEGETEEKIKELGLTAPRVTKESMIKKIDSVIFTTQLTPDGGRLRWCCITMKNGFTIVGEPSKAVSAENDNKVLGEDIAYRNSFKKMWELEGYLLAEKLSRG